MLLYHVSASENRESILSEGLNWELGESPWSIEYTGGNYFWLDYENAWDYVHTIGEPDQEFDIWEVDSADLTLLPDTEGEDGLETVFTTKRINVDKLKLAGEVVAQDWEEVYG